MERERERNRVRWGNEKEIEKGKRGADRLEKGKRKEGSQFILIFTEMMIP